MAIKKSTLRCFSLGVLIAHISFLSLSTEHVSNYSNIQLVLEALFLLIIFPYMKNVMFSLRNRNYNLLLIVFCALIVFSSYYNRSFSSSNTLYTFRYALSIFEVFLFAQYLQRTKMLKLGMQAVYYCLLFYCFLNDILMLCLPDSFSVDATSYTSLTDSFNFFLLGNKFSVSYLHLFALVFYYAITRLTGKRNRIKLFAHIVFAMFISAYVSCTTAIIGCILICFLWWREKFFVRLLSKPSFSLISIAIADSMLIVNSAIVTLPPVRYFVENVLKESIDLTGRIVAYSKLIPMISQSPWVGFGYENNYYISLEYLSIGNAQNGIMDCICSFGIVGTIVLILLVFLSIKKGNVERSYGFYTLLFVFIVLSAVETTMNLKFMSTLAFLAFAWDLEGFERAEQSAV